MDADPSPTPVPPGPAQLLSAAGELTIAPIVRQAAAIAILDAVAYLRSMQTIAVATTAAALRQRLDGGDEVEAAAAIDLASRAVQEAVELHRQVVEAAALSLRVLGHDAAGSPKAS
jgi:hypothetical protein